MAFTYYVCNLFTGEVMEEVPFTKFSYNRTLNRPGGWTAEIPYNHPKATRDILNPGAVGVYVDQNGSVRFGGLLWTAEVEFGGNLKVGGQGFLDIARDPRKLIRSRGGMTYATGVNPTEVTFTGVDQFRIVEDLVNHATFYNFGTVVDRVDFHGPAGGGLSGVTRDRTYWTYELKPIGEAIEQLSAVINGFDFSESYTWTAGDPDVITPRIDLWYPRKGGAQDLVLEQGKNLILLRQTLDATKLATRAIATGSGIGDAMLMSEAVDLAQEYPTGAYPLLQTVHSYPDVSIQETLDDHAARDLATYKYPVETLEVEILDITDSELGTFGEGDTFRVIANDGYVAVDGDYRIESMDVTISDTGFVKIGATMADEQASLGTA